MNSSLRTVSRSRTTRLIGSTAAVAVAVGGASLFVAPSAQAATGRPVVISAPTSVTSGVEFNLKCNIRPKSTGKGWKGSTAIVHEKGLPIHASRVIGAKGACSMKITLNATGKHKLRVVAISSQNIIKSSWITVKVS